MEDDQAQKPPSLLPYDDWTEQALRQVVTRALSHAAEHGLPGEHHFYLTFRTDHPGTQVSPRLKAQYPEEMTIILQHQFWGLQVDEEAGRISVGLSFGGVPATLIIPLGAVTAFADPAVGYGLRFRVVEEPPPPALPPPPAPEAPPDAEDSPPQVVSLDAFRRRGPAKD